MSWTANFVSIVFRPASQGWADGQAASQTITGGTTMLCSDFRAPRKNDPLLPDAGKWRNKHVYEGISDVPRARNWLPAFRSLSFELQGPCAAFTSWCARVGYTQALALPAHNQKLVLGHVAFVL